MICQTKQAKEVAKEPTQLDIERILNQHSYFRTPQEDYYFKRLEAGEKGEQMMLEYLEKYGKKEWGLLRNMWMNKDGPFEGDFILLTQHMSYLFEVKNYTSNFAYENGITKFNNRKHSGNPIHQTRRNTINLQDICDKLSHRIHVQGVLVLVGVDNYVEIHSEVKDIIILQRNQIKNYIQQIVEKDDLYKNKPINKKSLLRHFEKYEIERYYGPKAVPKTTIKKLRKGIYCLNCKSFDIKMNRKVIECSCGCVEDRTMAILRTICEYGVLTFNENLKIGELLDFFGGQVSHVSLRKVLRKYFVEIKKGRFTYYVNRKLPYYKLFRLLNIQSRLEVKIPYTDFII